jgi:DNA-binding CsgD family transcriptional regulator
MRATADLSDREVQILIYVMVDGMTQGDIADVIGVSRKTVVRDWQKIEEKLSAFRREFS